MLMVKFKIKVQNVDYGKGKAELIGVQLKTRYGESQEIIFAYVSPKTKNWTKEECEEIIENTLESLEIIIKAVKE